MYSMGPLSKLSEDALDVLGIARQQTLNRHAMWIDTEHLLLGIASLENCAGALLLARLGTRADHVLYELEPLLTEIRDDVSTWARVPMSTQAKLVLKNAADRGEERGTKADTRDLLWALLREHEGLAAQLLARSGVTLERLEEAMQELEGGE